MSENTKIHTGLSTLYEKQGIPAVNAHSDVYLADGLQNMMSGLGTNVDRTTANEWVRSYANQDWNQLIIRYREDWVAQKVCNIIPQDCTREWRKISTPEGIAADKKLKIRNLFMEAHQWARVFGTAAIFMDLKKAGRLETPLDLSRLKKNCINSLHVIDRTRLIPMGMVELDPLSPHYGSPEYYQLAGSTEKIHCSRFIRFEGTPLPMYEYWRNQWYSDSTLIPLRSTMDNFHTAAQSAAQLVSEANVDIFSIQGLQAMLTSPEGEMMVMKRFRLAKDMKSIYGCIIHDETEAYSNKTVALNGVKDLIWEYLRIIAAAVGIPATRFLSASPDGMNSTGESDLNNYIDLLKGIQEMMYGPRLETIDAVIQAHFGIEEYEYDWSCIFPESATQKQERESKLMDSVAKLVKEGAITPEAAHNLLVKAGVATKEELGEAPKHKPANAPSDKPDQSKPKSN